LFNKSAFTRMGTRSSLSLPCVQRLGAGHMLDQCAGFDVRHWLYLMGASAAGTKEEVLGDTGRSRGRLWVSCDRSNEDRVMWAAYLATRVFPVLAELESS
jgi:hypothetical protein